VEKEKTMHAEAPFKKGQVTLPQPVCEALKIKDGDTLLFDTDEQGMRLRVRPRPTFLDYVARASDSVERFKQDGDAATTALKEIMSQLTNPRK